MSSDNYLISALVPTYNSERFMRGLLEDLEAQTIASQLEIVIVDSNSPQKEGEIVKEFQKRYNNIVYLRTDEWENSHKATNRAIQLAHGKYLTLACTDDRHKRDAFERMVSVLEARPDIGLVYANSFITVEENETFSKHTLAGRYRWADFDPLKLLYGCFIGPQPMWRKKLHQTYGGFDENLKSAGDWDLWLHFAEGETFLHIDEFLGLYLYSPTSSEHRDPELSKREAQAVRNRYIHREPELKKRQEKAQINLPATSGLLALVVKDEKTKKEELEQCVERLRGFNTDKDGLSVKVVKAHLDVPENDLNVTVSPKTPLALKALSQGVNWEARYVLLLSPHTLIIPSSLSRLLAVAESDPSIAVVGPTSNEGPIMQRVEKKYDELQHGLELYAKGRETEYGNGWGDVPYLGNSCLLFKSEVISQIGGINDRLSLTEALWNLYLRLREKGFKLACALGAYVHQAEIREDKGLGFNDIADGERLFDLGDTDGAKRIFGKIHLADPNRIEALNNLGVIAYQQEAIDDAISYFTRVLKINPDYFESVENLGNCMVTQKAYREAIHWFKKALELKPDDVTILNSLANCYIQIEDFTGAEEVYSKSYHLNSGQVHVGEILVELGRLKVERRITP
ncbi:MAG: glycosyltransferase [Deltaproteobacteria bacterium]|nr:glycosyltransferase [Deltaproteobacteria bacterium]